MADAPVTKPVLVYSQSAACREAIDWLQMEALIFKTEGKTGNAAMAANVAKLIADLELAGAGGIK